MIENNTQLAATLFQMESFADTLEGMRRHAQQTEPSVFAVTSGGFINLLRERIAEAKAYVDAIPDVPQSVPPGKGSSDNSNTVSDTVKPKIMSQEALEAFDQYVQSKELGHRFVGQSDRYQNHKEKANKYISEVKNRKNTLSTMPDVYFDIIESPKLEAHAFYSDQYAFIGLNTGTIDLIYDMFYRMMSHPDILPHIGIASDENINSEPLFDMVQNSKHLNSPTPIPVDPLRKQVAEILAVLAVNYTVYHELAHLRFGHLKYEMSVDKRSNMNEKQQVGTDGNSSLTSQATEMNADAFATSEGLGYIFRLSQHYHLLPPPLNQAFAAPREALIIWFFAIYSLFRLFGEGNYSLESLEKLPHPPPRVRQMMVIQTVPAWLQRYKPSLDYEDFLDASVVVARLVEDAVAKITHGIVDTTGIEEAIDEKAIAHVENLMRHWTEIRPLILPYSHGEELAL